MASLQQVDEMHCGNTTSRSSARGPDPPFRLRPYQLQGIQWLWLLRRVGLHGLLSDDMGLGKTLQVSSVQSSTIACECECAFACDVTKKKYIYIHEKTRFLTPLGCFVFACVCADFVCRCCRCIRCRLLAPIASETDRARAKCNTLAIAHGVNCDMPGFSGRALGF